MNLTILSRNSHYSTPEIQSVGNLEVHIKCVHSVKTIFHKFLGVTQWCA